MVDPTDALVSFQEALSAGILALQPTSLHSGVFVHYDEPLPGQPRFTYVLLEGNIVTAFANLSPTDPLEGHMVFQIGYAVPPAYRGKGLARKIALAAIKEMDHGFRKNNTPTCYIEASVDDANIASQRVAESVFGKSVQSGKDERTGQPLKLYRKLIGKRPFEV